MLVDRKGEIESVMVGDSTQLYLPDIGRVRGGKDRLRGLRLIVARPSPLLRNHDFTYKLHRDFKTDLEKLRLDAVVEIDASKSSDGPIIVGYLESVRQENGSYQIVTKEKSYKNIQTIEQPFSEFISFVLTNLKLVDSNSALVKQKDRALLVGIYNCSKKEGIASMAELRELARSAKISVAEQKLLWRDSIDPKTVVGAKSLEDICLYALSNDIELIIFDRDLSPSQLMNITDLTDLKVLDRTMLILDIFAQRAVTEEGKIQVEMAQLTYSLPRLQKKQTGLSRLTGGIGGRGPGETKLSVNRNIIKERLARLADRLDKIKDQRSLRRQSRQNNQVPTLAIVGYTNAGKSTLLNSLSGSNIYAKDELFATLDPHSRRIRFPKNYEVVVTDTVGFINNLPKTLIKAFMATLEELKYSQILLHVIDLSNENCEKHIKVVNEVLKELELTDKPIILVFNKIDAADLEKIEAFSKKYPSSIFISAKNFTGLDNLIKDCERKLNAMVNFYDKNQTVSQDEEIFFDERD